MCIYKGIDRLIKIKSQIKSTLNSQKINVRQISYTLNIIRFQYTLPAQYMYFLCRYSFETLTIVKCWCCRQEVIGYTCSIFSNIFFVTYVWKHWPLFNDDVVDKETEGETRGHRDSEKSRFQEKKDKKVIVRDVWGMWEGGGQWLLIK